MQWRRCKVITRDFLMNADCKTAFGAIEESLLWSAEQRAASLAATLACRPDEGPVWIFGYGSLMWNPALEFTESCTGTLVGWHRAFCLRLTAGRGTAHQPGRMLAPVSYTHLDVYKRQSMHQQNHFNRPPVTGITNA